MKSRDHAFSWARRTTSGLLCLLMLFAMGSFALAAPRLDCCNVNYCPMQAHHGTASRADESGAMDCHHDMGAGAMLSCSLLCCHTSVHHFTAPTAFGLPHFAFYAGPPLVKVHSVMRAPGGPFRADKPTTPPPRI